MANHTKTGKKKAALGLIIYRGPSRLTGEPIVAIITGLGRRSKNAKTGGGLAQLWILPQHEAPHLAQRSGTDASVCGECPMRPLLASKRQAAGLPSPSCYVRTCQAPLSVWRSYRAGKYDPSPIPYAVWLLSRRGLGLRVGAYGDPAALPLMVLQPLFSSLQAHGLRWTAYTHAWRDAPLVAWLRSYCMASVSSGEELATATAAGWRCFWAVTGCSDAASKPGAWSAARRGGAVGSALARLWLGSAARVVPCPAEGGGPTTCSTCGLCSGSIGKGKGSIAIGVH